MPGISIITPVYQSEQFLDGCVESVLSQTFSDWELLLIDDGSTDRSPALCDAWAARDSRIHALHQMENRGVSAARNRGLDAARGECLAFLDADDRFAPAALETLWTLRRESGAEAAGCAHWNVTPEGGEAVELLLPEGAYRAEEVWENMLLPLFGERLRAPLFNGFLWRYLLSASRIRQEGIRFSGAYLEDELFLLDYFTSAVRSARLSSETGQLSSETGQLPHETGKPLLAVTERPLYRYLQNPASATRKYMRNLMEVMDGYMERKAALAERTGLGDACPRWRENSAWANLLIAIGNEYARGNLDAEGMPKSLAERREAVKALCARPDMAAAIRDYRPRGLGRKKQMVASLVRRRMFRTLTLLYRIKNHM